MDKNTMVFELPDVNGCDLVREELKSNAARTAMINCISTVYSNLVKENVNRYEELENLTLIYEGNVLQILGAIDTIEVKDHSYQGVNLGQQFNKESHFPYSFLRQSKFI